jgi:hypothetical protein
MHVVKKPTLTQCNDKLVLSTLLVKQKNMHSTVTNT